MNLRNALIVSLIGHCVVLTPLGNMGMLFPQKKANDIQITYCQIKPPEPKPEKIIEVKKVPPLKTAPEAKIQPAPKKEAPPEMRKKDIIKYKVRKLRAEARKPIPAKTEQKTDPAKQNIIPQSIPGTTLPNIPRCVSYYNNIRARILHLLEKNYSRDYGEGTVAVAFILDKAGQIIKLEIIEERSTDDPLLRQIASESVKNSAPFSLFPKGLDLNQISFSLTIVFRKN